MITLKNEFLTVAISERGAEIKSIVYDGTEYIWEGRPDVWASSCPLLFPICGGLKEDKYTLGGREYTLEKHGFVRRKTFEVESISCSSATFLSCSDDETKKCYRLGIHISRQRRYNIKSKKQFSAPEKR